MYLLCKCKYIGRGLRWESRVDSPATPVGLDSCLGGGGGGYLAGSCANCCTSYIVECVRVCAFFRSDGKSKGSEVEWQCVCSVWWLVPVVVVGAGGLISGSEGAMKG